MFGLISYDNITIEQIKRGNCFEKTSEAWPSLLLVNDSVYLLFNSRIMGLLC